MSACPPRFGRIGVFVAVNSERKDKMYRVAQLSLQCYLKSTNYSYFYFYYKRHCVAAHYLKEVDWMLFLDGDIGVVNPDHCIEEWIDERVDIIFYERFFNWEIMAGSYLMRNTEQSRRFLMEWAQTDEQQFDGFTGYDNGALQVSTPFILFLHFSPHSNSKSSKRLYPKQGRNNERVSAFTVDPKHKQSTCSTSPAFECIWVWSVRVFPSVLRIYRRAHGWARDLVPSGNLWAPSDFMIHGWKANRLGEATVFNADVFEELPHPSQCSRGLDGWKWRADKRVGTEELRQRLAQAERAFARAYSKVARDLPFLIEPDVADCFPNCENRPG
ncbi:hypothetical protein M3Y99_00464200 [Aphelenchoides fujianensis]|nr:hypothetical protein M3Y99_00464200 [Aphelenchoides fujianensis]